MRHALLIVLFACGSQGTPPPSEPAPSSAVPSATANDCVKTGCSGTVCVEPGKEVVTTCEYKAEYGCYREGICERQPDGSCGWTQSPSLQACLANPPPLEGEPAPQ